MPSDIKLSCDFLKNRISIIILQNYIPVNNLFTFFAAVLKKFVCPRCISPYLTGIITKTGKGVFTMLLRFINAFWVGGLICVVGQLLIDKTKLTPARILTSYVVAGVILGALGLYEPLLDFAGAGASVTLSGFGNTIAQGVKSAVNLHGWLGVFTGAITSAAAGITAALVFSFLASLLAKSADKA